MNKTISTPLASAPLSTDAEAATKRLSPKWHRVYYLLAAFDVLIVLLGMFLTYQIVGIYNHSILVNQEWVERRSEYSNLGKLAGAVDAPGNNVFDTYDVAGESLKMRAALLAFNERMATVEEELRVKINAHQPDEAIVQTDIEKLPEDLVAIKSAMLEMTSEADRIFSYFRQNQLELAGRRMAAMDNRYASVNASLDDLRNHVGVIQGKLFKQQIAAIDSLHKFEYLSAAFVFLMVGAATIYGYKIKKRMESDAREKESNLEEVQRERANRRFRLMTEAIPHIVWTANPDGFLDYYNQQWFDYTGMTLEQTEGWGWQPVLHPDDVGRCVEAWAHSVATGESYEIEYRFKRASDGQYRWHLGRAMPVRDANGQIVKWFGTCTDIDDHKRVEKELRKTREELEERVAHRTAELSEVNSSMKKEIAERQRAEEALTLESEMLRLLMNNIPDQLYFKDVQSRFTRVNRYMSFLGTASPEEAIGKTDFDFYAEEHAREAYEDEQRIIRTGEPLINKEERETFPDGNMNWVLSTKAPIFGASGEVIGIVGVSRSITERKRIEEELEQARDMAVESARLKSEFLANMSHEIRTPMNGVIGMAGLLLDTNLSADQRDFAETIRTSGDSLLTIINDILDFSKIEAGKLQFETLDFDLGNAVEGTVELLAERARDKKIELASLVYSDVPKALRGDPGRLRQVLTNLIGNAVKFTEQGEVVVRAEKESETDETLTVRFKVTDTGIGISEAAKRNLFQPFVQADGSTTRKYGGTGLGLAISKQLVELMGGEIGVESEPGKGSTFWFTARFDKQPSGAAGSETNVLSLNNLHVLIVDDNVTNRKILSHQLSSWGMIHDEADSGARALDLIRRAALRGAAYDLAILDLMMPGMDGFELARAIKADPAIAAVRLVMLTSYGQHGDGAKSREMGVAAYLTKPIRQSHLFDCLTSVLSQPSATIESAGSNAHAASGVLAKHSLQETKKMSNKLILLAEDNIVNQKVAVRQLQKLGYRADAVANGREAVKALDCIAYDLVLMDCQMPEMDGYEATAEIRRREGDTRHTPIVAMTANALEGDRAKCIAAGMDDYISKPVKPEELGLVLEKLLSESRGDESGSSVMPSEEVSPPVNLERLYLAMGNDPEEIADILGVYLEQMSVSLKRLDAAIALNDSGEVSLIGHNCVGVSANCGIDSLVGPLRELERMGNDGRLEGAADLSARVGGELERVRLFLRENLEQMTV